MRRTTRVTRTCAIGLVIAIGSLGSLSPAGAATTWVRSPAPNPGPLMNDLRSVSCVSATSCTAVGSRHDVGPSGWQSLIERTTDGGKWTVAATPRPAAGWTGNQLAGVSCVTADSCTAVGYATNSTSFPPEPPPRVSPVILRTNGTTWARVVAPTSGGPSYLFAVSCPTALSCTAVGRVGPKTLILRTDDGASWVRQPSPNPGANLNRLDGVSCVSATECTGVGSFSQGNEIAPRRTLVLRTTNGADWSRVKTPNPSPDPGLNQLTSVTCTGTTCVAVGLVGQDASNVKRALVLRTTDGVSWSRLTTTPTTPGAIELTGVSCSSTTVCATVGIERNAGNTAQHPFIAQTTDGTTWLEVPSPDPGDFAIPVSASCPTVDHCFSVGNWSGSRPRIQLRTLVLKET